MEYPFPNSFDRDTNKKTTSATSFSKSADQGIRNEPLSPSEYTQDEIVTVLIGPDRKPYRLHKTLLQRQSPYFATRLKTCWDGEAKALEFEDLTEGGFKAFVDWMYTGDLPKRLITSSTSSKPLRAAYKVADRLMVPALQNQLINFELITMKSHDHSYQIESVLSLWIEELTHTPYYKLVLKSAVPYLMRKPLKDKRMTQALESLKDYPDALADLLEYINQWNTKRWPEVWDGDWCEFHVHADGERCPQIPRRAPRRSSAASFEA